MKVSNSGGQPMNGKRLNNFGGKNPQANKVNGVQGKRAQPTFSPQQVRAIKESPKGVVPKFVQKSATPIKATSLSGQHIGKTPVYRTPNGINFNLKKDLVKQNLRSALGKGKTVK